MSEIPTAEQSVNQMVSTIFGMQKTPVAAAVGLVIAPPPSIKVAWNGIILEKENLYIDVTLLKNYGRNVNGKAQMPNAKGNTQMDSAKGNLRTNSANKSGGVGKARYASHHHKINNSYRADLKGSYDADITGDYYSSMIYTDFGIQAGDLVSLLPINDAQQFIILGKVAYLGDLSEKDFKDTSKPIKRLF